MSSLIAKEMQHPCFTFTEPCAWERLAIERREDCETYRATLETVRSERNALRIGMDAAHRNTERTLAERAELIAALTKAEDVLGLILLDPHYLKHYRRTVDEAVTKCRAMLDKVRP